MSDRHCGPREMVSGGEWIFGRNPVEEALAAGRRTCTEIILPPTRADEDAQIARIRDEAHARRMVVRTMDRDKLDRLVRFGHHQGVAMKVSAFPYSTGLAESFPESFQASPRGYRSAMGPLNETANRSISLSSSASIGAMTVIPGIIER